MAKYSIHKLAKVGSLAPRTVTSLTAELSQMTIESDAKKIMQDNIQRLRDIGSYRGRRHAMSLPVRGQRSRTQTSTANKLNRLDRKR
jgi:small subunit ribosomal protein S13